jgi:alkylation response protein AidB-like acyl-CoA dehydrogenase
VDDVIDQGNEPLAESALRAKRFTEDPRAVARELRPIIEAGAAESEELALLSPQIVDALCESGLLGLLVPRELGGIEADPATCIDVIEELSYADGSTGWVALATIFGTKGAGIYCGPKAVDAIFNGEGSFVAASSIAPNGKAERVDGGYRISGGFQFGSGSQIASWFMGGFVLHENGAPARTESGGPKVLMAFAPRDKVVLDYGSWDVMGLKATASYDFFFVDQFVEEDFLMDWSHRRHGGPSLDISVSMGHVTFSLGVAMRILDELKALAQRKQRQGRLTLIDQPTFQRDFGMMRALLDAARSHIRVVYEEWRQDAEANGTATLATRAQARLAACWATKVSTDVARFAYNAAGSDGLRDSPDNRLQRCFRDIEAGAVHRHVDENVLIECTQVLLGVNSPTLVLI